MAPEYGATMGFFPVDEKTLSYLLMTGRGEKEIERIREYLEVQKLFGIPRKGAIDYTQVIELDLGTVESCVAGPKRPQDRIVIGDLKKTFQGLLTAKVAEGGYGKEPAELAKMIYLHADGSFVVDVPHDSGGTTKLEDSKAGWSEHEMISNRPFTKSVVSSGYLESLAYDSRLFHGAIVIAAITSCTNTSNPDVMIAAGLLAKKAVSRGLKVGPMVKASLAPGSRVVTDYLKKTGLQTYLDQLGFQLVAYGCTTCIGNSGPLDSRIENAIKENDIIAASVLSGNRNFEARIHSSVKSNFLMSPPLVVAFALAGRVDIDMTLEPLGVDSTGKPVFLREIWPSSQEIHEAVATGLDPEMFKTRYANIREDNPVWDRIEVKSDAQYVWKEKSTYIRKPPYFANFSLQLPKRKEFSHMRPLALLGDSVTTDHISPAGAFKAGSSAGQYLLSCGVTEEDFNSYGSRRGNHEVMMRGTFANVRIVNKMAGGKEGGYTRLMPEEALMPIHDACEQYRERNIPLIIFAGKDYGMGSSRDWAAKGTALLGVRAVVAESFERIHRSNLIGMGVIPLRFQEKEGWEDLGITGKETFSLLGLDKKLKPQQEVILEIERGSTKDQRKLIACIDTPMEVEYYEHGGILDFVLRQLLSKE